MSANLIPSLSKLFSNPITNFWVGYNGYLLGKSTGTLEYTPEFDVKDIIYTQDGTKAEDHVYTGSDHMVSLTLSEKVNENLFSLLVPGWEHAINSNMADSIIAKSLYLSLRDTRGSVLQIIAALPDGSPSEDPNDIITLYLAIPLIDSAIFKFGADQQQEMPVSFRCKTVNLGDLPGSSITSIIYNGKSISKVFGYMGSAASIGVPAAVIPDRSGPEVLSVSVSSATAMKVTFNKDLDPQFFGQGYAYSGDASGSLAAFQAANDVEVAVEIDNSGTPINVTGINTSGATGLNGVATILQVAIRGAGVSLDGVTVLYNSGKSRFEVISDSYGVSSQIELTAVSGGTGTNLLGASLFNGSTTVAGKNGIKTVTALTALVSNTSDQKFKTASSAAINGVNENEVDFTFGASSFAANDVITIFLASDLCADVNGNVNQSIGVGAVATNAI